MMNLGVLLTSKFSQNTVVVTSMLWAMNSTKMTSKLLPLVGPLLISLPIMPSLLGNYFSIWKISFNPTNFELLSYYIDFYKKAAMEINFLVVTTLWVKTPSLQRTSTTYLVTMVSFSLSIFGWLTVLTLMIMFKLLLMVKSTDFTDLILHMVMLLTSYVVLLDGLKELSRLISSFHIEVLQSTSLSEVALMKAEIMNLLVSVTSELSLLVVQVQDANKFPTNSTKILLVMLSTGLIFQVFLFLSKIPSLHALVFLSLVLSKYPLKNFMITFLFTQESEFSWESFQLVLGLIPLVYNSTSMMFYQMLQSLLNLLRTKFAKMILKVSEITLLMFLIPALAWT